MFRLKVKSRFVAGAVVAVLAIGAGPATAQNEPGGLKLDLGYDGRVYIKVLNVSFVEQVSPTAHSSSAHLTSSGILSALRRFDLRASTQGRVVHGEILPGSFSHQNIDGKKDRKVQVVWNGSDVVTSSTPAFTFWGDPPPTRAQKLASADPMTQMARLMMASTAQGPCQGASHFFNGKELYDLGFSDPHPTALSTADQKLGLVNGVRCHAVYREVAGYKKKAGKERNEGLDRPIIVDFAQVGVDGPWVIATMRAHTPIGSAVIDLTRLKMTGARPAL